MDWLLLGSGVCIPLNNLAITLVDGHSQDKDWVCGVPGQSGAAALYCYQ